MSAHKYLALWLAPAVWLLGCGASKSSVEAPEPETLALCDQVGPMLDLRVELLAPVPCSGDAASLASYDARLAAVGPAEERLSKVGNKPEVDSLRERVRTLATALREEQKIARSLARAVSDSHVAINAALTDASTCQGINLRHHLPNGRSSKAKIAESRACANTRRIVEAIGNIDLDSSQSSANVGRHLSELSMTGSGGAARDELSAALQTHANHLAAFQKHTSGEGASQTHTQIDSLTDDLDRLAGSCLRAVDESPSGVIAGSEPPRRITVLVRPTWEDQYGKSKPTGSFGSGVLVRWRLPSGHTEVRVVSNAHVLGGAQHADIVAADDLDKKPKSEKVDRTWRAHVLRISDDDDLAVLRLEADEGAPETGVALRFSPPDEEETVVAAGFPGIGSRPSFQISRGTISNRNFVNNESAFGGYLQHTSPIDPGNSGGPLLDADGQLLGLNTIKIRGRDSVGLAIPTARVHLALARADDERTVVAEHASALCQALLGELSSNAPTGAIVEYISLSLANPNNHTLNSSVTAVRNAVRSARTGPEWDTRLTAFAQLRVRLDEEGGLSRLASCSAPRKLREPGSFELSFESATAEHSLQVATENGILRVVHVE